MKTRINEEQMERAKKNGFDYEELCHGLQPGTPWPDWHTRAGITKMVFSPNGVGGFDVVITHAKPLPKFRRPSGGTKAIRPPGTTF